MAGQDLIIYFQYGFVRHLQLFRTTPVYQQPLCFYKTGHVFNLLDICFAECLQRFAAQAKLYGFSLLLVAIGAVVRIPLQPYILCL